MKKTIIIILIFLLTPTVIVFGAYLENVPITVTQPDGTILNLFATGDEYYNWLHDENGYTVVINPKTKYYCYAILKKDELVASYGIVGKANPLKMGLKPKINISAAKIDEIQKVAYDLMNEREQENSSNRAMKASNKKSFEKINNIVIFIRFADQTEFATPKSYYTSMFNSTSEGANSMRNYFMEASYGKLDINTTFYPTSNGNNVFSYKDTFESGYYWPIDICPIGYNGKTEKKRREDSLIIRAINSVKSQIPATLDIDNNNDGYVDNVCFIIKGNISVGYGLLWPHKDVLHPKAAYINDKRVFNYNIQIEDFIKRDDEGIGVLCHEMNHTLGAPDLYHKNIGTPIGKWCLMSHNQNPPQHMCAYVKYKYNKWIPEMPTITESGTYSLNPLTSATNNCYKIAIKGSTEYLVLEYRRKTGTFESSVDGSGLIIYRVNERENNTGGDGYYGGEKDRLYVFRPNGSLTNDGVITSAFLSAQSGRNSFNNNSNPYCFVSNGSKGNIFIKNIKETNGKLSFDVRFCDGMDIVKISTSNLSELTNASKSISTQNTVIVKSTDNVIFEAENEVTLNPGFEVKLGGEFEINMNGCGEK